MKAFSREYTSVEVKLHMSVFFTFVAIVVWSTFDTKSLSQFCCILDSYTHILLHLHIIQPQFGRG